MQSAAVIDLEFDASTDKALSLSEIYLLEQDIGNALLNILQDSDLQPLGAMNEPLQVFVAAREQSLVAGRRTLDAIVTCVHLSDQSPVDLDTALMRAVKPTQLHLANLDLSFRPYRDYVVLDQYNHTSRTAADKGLIAATAFLSAMLVVVSSVLLYVTGGWLACKSRLNNCLFEEVADDHYLENKGTFQVDDGYEDDDEVGMMDGDEESLQTGIQTAPSGILGVQQAYYEDPAAGLGIQTPAQLQYEVGDETPMSHSNRPLGITSMREMPPPATPEVKGGLTHLIMQRFTTYSNNNGQS